MTPTIAPGQTWTPAAGSRAEARRIVRVEHTPNGDYVRYQQKGWPHTGIPGSAQHPSFRAWIRRHRATLTPPDLAAELDAVGASGLGAAT